MRRRADISRYELIELFPGTDPGLPMGWRAESQSDKETPKYDSAKISIKKDGKTLK